MLIKKLSDNSKEYLESYYQIVDTLNNQLKNITYSNCISEIFIQQTLSIYESAIDLSNNILKYTTDTEIENVAKVIINQSNNSIEYLNSIFNDCKCCTNSERDMNLYKRKAIEIITLTINKLNTIQAGNNLNVLYLQAILYLNEGIFALTKNVLSYELFTALKQHLNEQIIKLTSLQTLIRKLLSSNKI